LSLTGVGICSHAQQSNGRCRLDQGEIHT
jgi:hypothetical protein